jgi:UV DNA damage endonuclease
MAYNLCCISNTLANQGHKFQTMTWHRFSQLPREEAVATVSARTLNNIRVTYKILEQCASNGWGYRVSSNLFPLLTYDVAELKLEDYPDYIDIQAALADCNLLIRDKSIRISCHPDQFNVLASLGKAQVEKTIKELNHHGWLMDMLGAHRDYRCPINIHVNNTKGEPQEIADRFMLNLRECDQSVRSRLVLENEDKGIWTPKLLAKHFMIPITYDNLHHKCLPDGLTETEAFTLCYKTWHRTGYFKPLFHYSESHPDKPNPRSHADMPTELPRDGGYSFAVDYDIELKSKDDAITAIEYCYA